MQTGAALNAVLQETHDMQINILLLCALEQGQGHTSTSISCIVGLHFHTPLLWQGGKFGTQSSAICVSELNKRK